MGIDDMDYYRKSQKLRIQRLTKREVYYHPKEFRRGSKPNYGRPLSDRPVYGKISRRQ